MFPLLWGVAALRAGVGKREVNLPAITAVLQGSALLFALPAAFSLPNGWIGATALAAAELLAVTTARAPGHFRGVAAT